MRQPYVGGGRGSLVTAGGTDEEKVAELTSMIGLVHRAGLQIGVHSTGDAAIDAVAAGYAKAVRSHPSVDARHYVIHGDFTWPETLRSLARNGCGINFNPNIKYLISDTQPDVVGAERSAYQTPYRSALRAGVRVASASDSPNVAPDWRQGLETILLREGAAGTVSGSEETIGVREALRTYTTTAAWQDHADSWKGTLEPGMAADLCVLGQRLFDAHGRLAVDAHDVSGTQVDCTVVDGKIVYDGENAAQRKAAAQAQQVTWAVDPNPRLLCAHC
ncbi:amidohydrolase family protein [Streptomyces sp. NPDC088812]|uniref:amidohydrolase family protein n=1 Tax=Streptomyces sp. NPDC088812 TaxID=3365905 RepID=UPI0037F759E4